MDKELISVIVPIYNQEKYIEKCVKSIEAQTYKHIELILVNDGSSDATEIICDDLKNQYDNIRYFYQRNSGVSSARNLGVEKSSANYIMFVDPDDYLQENIIERLFERLSNDTDIIICSAYSFNEKSREVCHFFPEDTIFNNIYSKEKLFLQILDSNMYQVGGAKGCSSGVPWGKIYRKDVFIKNNITFNTFLTRMQDNVFNMWCFAYARTVVYLDTPLYYYNREHISKVKAYNPLLLYNIIKERHSFFQCFPNFETCRVKEEEYREVCRFLKSSIEYICDTENIKTSQDRIREICTWPYYAHAIQEKKYKKRLLMKVVSHSVSKSNYLYIVLLFKFYYKFIFGIRCRMRKIVNSIKLRTLLWD